MNLKLQILTLSYSFLYGILFSLLLSLSYKLIYNKNKHIKIVSTCFFILTNVIIYFLLLKKINSAIIHPYYLLIFILGFLLETSISKLVAKHFKK